MVAVVAVTLLASQVGTAFAAPKLQQEQSKNPVANALAMFFSDIADYDGIMAAHKDGTGFGVIAQALWLTTNMEGDSDVFTAILEAKKSGDYTAFTLEDGTVPTNWGQFKKTLLAGDKKQNLGMVISAKNKDKHNNDNGQEKDKSNNGKNK